MSLWFPDEHFQTISTLQWPGMPYKQCGALRREPKSSVFCSSTRISGPFGPEILALSGLGSNWSKAVNLIVVLRFWIYKKFWLWLAFWFLILRKDWVLHFDIDDPHWGMVMLQLKVLYLPSEYRNEIWYIIYWTHWIGTGTTKDLTDTITFVHSFPQRVMLIVIFWEISWPLTAYPRLSPRL